MKLQIHAIPSDDESGFAHVELNYNTDMMGLIQQTVVCPGEGEFHRVDYNVTEYFMSI